LQYISIGSPRRALTNRAARSKREKLEREKERKEKRSGSARAEISQENCGERPTMVVKGREG